LYLISIIRGPGVSRVASIIGTGGRAGIAKGIGNFKPFLVTSIALFKY
jgi:hypothetical protein